MATLVSVRQYHHVLTCMSLVISDVRNTSSPVLTDHLIIFFRELSIAGLYPAKDFFNVLLYFSQLFSK